MIRTGSNFGDVQQRLQIAARTLGEARAVQRPASDNTDNWRSAKWLWPASGPTLGQE